ncbi:MAG: hypothetical protein ACI9LL_000229 [Porticoccus sp.]|jgi:hypothetical protein
MIHTNLAKLIYLLRSKIRFARYKAFHQAPYNNLKDNRFFSPNDKLHPVTLGPEQLSRFFTYIANTEHSKI